MDAMNWEWVNTDVQYKPNNRGNKLTGTVSYKEPSTYCDKTLFHYEKFNANGFTFYQPAITGESRFPKNILHLLYNVRGDRKLCEQHSQVVQHCIYELYHKEVKRNELLWKLANVFLDSQTMDKNLLKLIGQSDIYCFTLRNVLDGFSEIQRLRSQYDLLLKKIEENKE